MHGVRRPGSHSASWLHCSRPSMQLDRFGCALAPDLCTGRIVQGRNCGQFAVRRLTTTNSDPLRSSFIGTLPGAGLLFGPRLYQKALAPYPRTCFCRFCRAGGGRARSGSLSRPSACIPCAAWMSRRKHSSSYRKRGDSTTSRPLSGAVLFRPSSAGHEAPPPTAFLSVAPGLMTYTFEAATDICAGCGRYAPDAPWFRRCRIRGVARLRHPPEPRRSHPTPRREQRVMISAWHPEAPFRLSGGPVRRRSPVPPSPRPPRPHGLRHAHSAWSYGHFCVRAGGR